MRNQFESSALHVEDLRPNGPLVIRRRLAEWHRPAFWINILIVSFVCLIFGFVLMLYHVKTGFGFFVDPDAWVILCLWLVFLMLLCGMLDTFLDERKIILSPSHVIYQKRGLFKRDVSWSRHEIQKFEAMRVDSFLRNFFRFLDYYRFGSEVHIHRVDGPINILDENFYSPDEAEFLARLLNQELMIET